MQTMTTTTLLIIKDLSIYLLTGKELCEKYGISIATLKRNIAEAKHLGADIQSVKRNNENYYELKNWMAIKHRSERWLDLQLAQSLTEKPQQNFDHTLD